MREVHIHFHILRGIETITEHGMAMEDESEIKTTERERAQRTERKNINVTQQQQETLDKQRACTFAVCVCA